MLRCADVGWWTRNETTRTAARFPFGVALRESRPLPPYQRLAPRAAELRKEQVFGRVGRADTATDPAPLSMLETTIHLKPENVWRPGMTPKRLTEAMNRAIRFPGVTQAIAVAVPAGLGDVTAEGGAERPVGVPAASLGGAGLLRVGRHGLSPSLSARRLRLVGRRPERHRLPSREARRMGAFSTPSSATPTANVDLPAPQRGRIGHCAEGSPDGRENGDR